MRPKVFIFSVRQFMRPFPLCVAILLFLADAVLAQFAPVWKSTAAPKLNWTCVASSADGTTFAAGADDGAIYTSTNSGAAWISNNVPPFGWTSIAVSPDGTVLAALRGFPGLFYISTNSGAIWQLNPDVRGYSLAFSADGSHLVVVGDGFYTSTNSGTTWAFNNNMSGNLIALSGDGSQLLIVGGGEADALYVSTNSGSSWLVSLYFSGPDEYFVNVTSSADGSKLTACPISQGIIVSTNLGQTWGLSGLKTGFWTDATSVDASRLVTAESCEGEERGIYTSIDFAATWTSNNAPDLCWQQVACSQDGTRLVAIAEAEETIYTAQWPPDLNIQPSGDSIVISWPAPSTGFVLQQNADLTMTNWVTVSTPPITSNYQNQVTLPPSSNAMMFRLAGPSF